MKWGGGAVPLLLLLLLLLALGVGQCVRVVRDADVCPRTQLPVPDVEAVLHLDTLHGLDANEHITHGLKMFAQAFQTIVAPDGDPQRYNSWFYIASFESRQLGRGMIAAERVAGTLREAVKVGTSPSSFVEAVMARVESSSVLPSAMRTLLLQSLVHVPEERKPYAAVYVDLIVAWYQDVPFGVRDVISTSADRIHALLKEVDGDSLLAKMTTLVDQIVVVLELENRGIYGDLGKVAEHYLQWRNHVLQNSKELLGSDRQGTLTGSDVRFVLKVLSKYVPPMPQFSRADARHVYGHVMANLHNFSPFFFKEELAGIASESFVVAAYALFETAGIATDHTDADRMVMWANSFLAYRAQAVALQPIFDAHMELLELLTPIVALPLGKEVWTFSHFVQTTLPPHLVTEFNWGILEERWPAVLDVLVMGCTDQSVLPPDNVDDMLPHLFGASHVSTTSTHDVTNGLLLSSLPKPQVTLVDMVIDYVADKTGTKLANRYFLNTYIEEHSQVLGADLLEAVNKFSGIRFPAQGVSFRFAGPNTVQLSVDAALDDHETRKGIQTLLQAPHLHLLEGLDPVVLARGIDSLGRAATPTVMRVGVSMMKRASEVDPKAPAKILFTLTGFQILIGEENVAGLSELRVEPEYQFHLRTPGATQILQDVSSIFLPTDREVNSFSYDLPDATLILQHCDEPKIEKGMNSRTFAGHLSAYNPALVLGEGHSLALHMSMTVTFVYWTPQVHEESASKSLSFTWSERSFARNGRIVVALPTQATEISQGKQSWDAVQITPEITLDSEGEIIEGLQDIIAFPSFSLPNWLSEANRDSLNQPLSEINRLFANAVLGLEGKMGNLVEGTMSALGDVLLEGGDDAIKAFRLKRYLSPSEEAHKYNLKLQSNSATIVRNNIVLDAVVEPLYVFVDALMPLKDYEGELPRVVRLKEVDFTEEALSLYLTTNDGSECSPTL